MLRTELGEASVSSLPLARLLEAEPCTTSCCSFPAPDWQARFLNQGQLSSPSLQPTAACVGTLQRHGREAPGPGPGTASPSAMLSCGVARLSLPLQANTPPQLLWPRGTASPRK